MVVEALFYMFFVGFGTAAGVATVGFISWKIWQRMNRKSGRKKKGVAF